MFCGYDAAGNLFADGVAKDNALLLAELPHGGNTLTDITLSKQIGNYAGPVQWDGKYVTIELWRPPVIYQVRVSGSRGTIVGETKIRNQTKTKNVPHALTYIYADIIIATEGLHNKRLAYWNYPAGGKPTNVLNNLLKGKKNGFGDVTVSVGAMR